MYTKNAVLAVEAQATKEVLKSPAQSRMIVIVGLRNGGILSCHCTPYRMVHRENLITLLRTDRSSAGGVIVCARYLPPPLMVAARSYTF